MKKRRWIRRKKWSEYATPNKKTTETARERKKITEKENGYNKIKRNKCKEMNRPHKNIKKDEQKLTETRRNYYK